ncbi:MAG: hypothetical protein HY560_14145 [Gemmatimonadetes bacterium]|nr:hypothetical protein [Gemmatimonadota bacterium]
MKRHRLIALVAGLALAAACSNDTTAPDAPLNVDLQVSAGHIHALETDVSYTVLVTDPTNGRLITDFETIRVDQNLVGTNAWRKLGLTGQVGGSYAGTHKFLNPGNYYLRVVGQRRHQSVETVLKQVATPLQAIRSHFDAGGYRVEFDISPGFPDELTANTAYTVKFYVMQATPDASGSRAPITGLAGVKIRCREVDGSLEEHPVTDNGSPGLYQAVHTFKAKGVVWATLSFTGSTGAASVNVPLTLQ